MGTDIITTIQIKKLAVLQAFRSTYRTKCMLLLCHKATRPYIKLRTMISTYYELHTGYYQNFSISKSNTTNNVVDSYYNRRASRLTIELGYRNSQR